MTDPADRRIALIVVILASFLTPFTGSSVNIALPSIAREFTLDAVTLGWIPTAYLLASAITLVPAGRLADIYGRKRMFLYGSIVFGAASLIIALSPNALILILFRIVQGVGGAMVFGVSVAILVSVYPPHEKGRALGYNVATVYVGLSVGPTVGGFLTQHLGWRSVFYVIVPLSALVVALTAWRLKQEWAEARGDPFDFGGAGLYGVSLLAVMYGFSSLPAAQGMGLLALGVAGGVAFVWWEGRTASPVLDIRIFKNNAVFTFSNLAALINYSATSASGFLLSLYLQQIKGLPPQSAGLIMMAQPLVQALFSPLAGRLSDTIEPRLLASLGMGLAATGLILFTFLSEQTPIAYVLFVLMLLGLGFALFSSPNTNAVMSAVQKRFYGVASATLSTMRVVGQTLSIGIAVLVFAVYMGRVAITPEHYPLLMSSIRIIYSIFTVLCIGGVFASLARGNLR